MKDKVKIGIPRGLLYYKHELLWKTFLEEIGTEVIISPETNKKILEKGAQYSIDENCLSAKVYMGHVDWLRGKVDYVFVPRIASYCNQTHTCVKFFAMPDTVRNTFRDIKVITYNLDIKKGKTEKAGFLKLGLAFNKNILQVMSSYEKAKKMQLEYEKEQYETQNKVLDKEEKLKILMVAHPYNMYDKLIGYPVKNYLKKLDVEVIFADKADKNRAVEASYKISESLYWTYNQEILGAIELYKNKIDGVIFLTTFPCGPDSLVNDLCSMKIKNIPCSYIVIDELQGETGIQTRLESFVDIVSARKNSKRLQMINQ